MSNLKREEIIGAMIQGKWIAKVVGQWDIQPDEAGVVVKAPTEERTFYPWAAIDYLTLISRASEQ